MLALLPHDTARMTAMTAAAHLKIVFIYLSFIYYVLISLLLGDEILTKGLLELGLGIQEAEDCLRFRKAGLGKGKLIVIKLYQSAATDFV